MSDSPVIAFRLPLEVVAASIDVVGHVNNIEYLRWVQDIAVGHSDAVGFTWEAYQKLGAVFVVRRHEIDYLRPVLRGDRLELRTWIDSAFAAKCKRGTSIVRLATDDKPEIQVASAMTTWGYVELATGRPTRIPDEIRVAFGQPTMRSSRSEPAPPSE